MRHLVAWVINPISFLFLRQKGIGGNQALFVFIPFGVSHFIFLWVNLFVVFDLAHIILFMCCRSKLCFRFLVLYYSICLFVVQSFLQRMSTDCSPENQFFLSPAYNKCKLSQQTLILNFIHHLKLCTVKK